MLISMLSLAIPGADSSQRASWPEDTCWTPSPRRLTVAVSVGPGAVAVAPAPVPRLPGEDISPGSPDQRRVAHPVEEIEVKGEKGCSGMWR